MDTPTTPQPTSSLPRKPHWLAWLLFAGAFLAVVLYCLLVTSLLAAEAWNVSTPLTHLLFFMAYYIPVALAVYVAPTRKKLLFSTILVVLGVVVAWFLIDFYAGGYIFGGPTPVPLSMYSMYALAVLVLLENYALSIKLRLGSIPRPTLVSLAAVAFVIWGLIVGVFVVEGIQEHKEHKKNLHIQLMGNFRAGLQKYYIAHQEYPADFLENMATLGWQDMYYHTNLLDPAFDRSNVTYSVGADKKSYRLCFEVTEMTPRCAYNDPETEKFGVREKALETAQTYLKKYFEAHKKYPATLSELKQAYSAEITIDIVNDPVMNRPFEYLAGYKAQDYSLCYRTAMSLAEGSGNVGYCRTPGETVLYGGSSEDRN